MKTFFELKKFAKENMIPIIRPKSAKLLRDFCRNKKPKRILEIGTAIGYSSALMLHASKDSFVTTIEKDEAMANIARQTFKERNLLKKVRLIENDAFVALNKLKNEKFDFIFLDGPKGQYFKYLSLLKNMMGVNGYLLADDVLFHGYVKKEGDPGHKHRTIVASLRSFIKDLTFDPNFATELFEYEDGLLLCQRLK